MIDQPQLAAKSAGNRPIRTAPLAMQVEQILIRRLRSGEFRPGDQLPPEHDLADELGVSRATVRLAITALGRTGLIVGRHGVGNFVSEASRIANSLVEAVDLNDVIARNGSVPGVLFDGAALVKPDHAVAAALALDGEGLVLRTAKRFTADGVPLIYVISSIPVRVLGHDLANAAAADPTITEPLFGFLERLGLSTEFQVTSLSAVLGAQMAYPKTGEPGVARNVPVIELSETGYAAKNVPVWHSCQWYPPSTMRFELVRQRPPDDAVYRPGAR